MRIFRFIISVGSFVNFLVLVVPRDMGWTTLQSDGEDAPGHGCESSPLRTLGQAVECASSQAVVPNPVISVREGVYYESNISITCGCSGSFLLLFSSTAAGLAMRTRTSNSKSTISEVVRQLSCGLDVAGLWTCPTWGPG